MLAEIFKPGRIDIYYGPMFSGKTLKLLQELSKVNYSKGLKFKIFGADIDTRTTDKNKLQSHANTELQYDFPIQRVSTKNPEEILKHINDEHIIAIDELQFFSDDMIGVIMKLKNMGKQVLLSGLDLDFRKRKFGPITTLLHIAKLEENIHSHRCTATCTECGLHEGIYTYRKDLNKEAGQVQVGDKETYGAACSECYEKIKNDPGRT